MSSDNLENHDQDPFVPEVCSFCNGTGVEIVPGLGARPCQCRVEQSRHRLLEAAQIPNRYARCDFVNFEPEGNDSLYWALMKAKSLVNDYPAVEKGLLLMGPVGSGKTHLAVSILKGLTQKGVPCLFSEFGSLLKQIQDSYNPISQTSELRVLAPVYEAEVLVLDELGATVPTDWVRDTMYQIINRRYNDRKLTIFTTNYQDQPAPLAEGAGKKADRDRSLTTLEERIGTRLRSRLYEMCFEVKIDGADFRKQLANRRLSASRGQ